MYIGLPELLAAMCCLCCSLAQIMPGLSPATPNNALDICERKAVPRPLTVTPEGSHGDIISRWCSTYDSVLPCLNKVLLTSTDSANDWFLSLVYNQPMADRMSRSMCSRFPHISNLTCVTTNMANVSRCMQWNTRTAIENFRKMHNPNVTLSPELRGIAAIYACIISVQTAGCFQHELSACSQPKRKLIHDYYIMLSGKCTEIAILEETTTDALPTISSTTEQSTRRLLVGRPNPSDRDAPRDTASQSNSQDVRANQHDSRRHGGGIVGPTTTDNGSRVHVGNVAVVIMTSIMLLFLNI